MSKMTSARKRQTAPYLYIAGLIIIVAVVAVSVLNNYSNLEGAVPSTAKALKYQSYCADDDPKDDFYVAGTVQMGTNLYADGCSKDTLFQHYCSSGRNVKTRRAYTCPNGCLNGACLRLLKEVNEYEKRQ